MKVSIILGFKGTSLYCLVLDVLLLQTCEGRDWHPIVETAHLRLFWELIAANSRERQRRLRESWNSRSGFEGQRAGKRAIVT